MELSKSQITNKKKIHRKADGNPIVLFHDDFRIENEDRPKNKQHHS
jgi:hypothetical protein